MAKSDLDILLEEWKRLGLEVDSEAADYPVDPERTLVESARLLPLMARLLPLTVTWVSYCEQLIDPAKLQAMALRLADGEQLACLGLLLSFAREITKTDHLSAAISACVPISSPVAMLTAERTPAYRRIVEHEAHPISRQWGILAPLPEVKHDAIRPTSWILEHNPALRIRAMLGGHLKGTIFSTLSTNPAAGASESALARELGATRKAVREALDHLEYCGLIRREKVGRNVRIRACQVEIQVR